jgi:hypothetical protein
MLVITAGRCGRTEQILAENIKRSELPGILLVQVKVGLRNRVREVDALLLHPSGALTIEGKYTSLAGEVTPYVGGWTVGGQTDVHLGDPESQASQQAKILASLLSELGRKRSRVRAIVSVAGEKATMEPRRLNSDALATHLRHLNDVLAAELHGPAVYDVDDILAIRDALTINPSMLSREIIEEQWNSAGAPLVRSPETVAAGARPRRRASEHIPTPRGLAYLSALLFALSALPSSANIGAGAGVGILAGVQYLRNRRRAR